LWKKEAPCFTYDVINVGEGSGVFSKHRCPNTQQLTGV